MMELLTGTTRIAFLGFFLSHIPISLFLDGQSVLIPTFWVPKFMEDVSLWYANTLNDPHFLDAPTFTTWFASLTTCELLFQVPYFFMASHMIYHYTPTKKKCYPEWFRLCNLVYGAHTSTTLIPILAVILANPNATWGERILLTGLYAPYLIFPLYICLLSFPTKQDSQIGVFPTLNGFAKYVLGGFYIIHIPITVCIDAQVVVPSVFYPSVLQDLLQWYVDTLQDPLMTTPYETWFSSIILGELLLQFPFFFVISQQLYSATTPSKWFASACVVYASHTLTTMVPIYCTMWSENNVQQDESQKILTTLVYISWTIFPAWLGYLALFGSSRGDVEKKIH